MKEERLNLVITGHVDHGKSTLIGRLLYETGALQEGLIKEIKANLKGTGIKMEFAHIMDYFEEERRQARTIDTTQFFFNTKRRHYVIIDTPGHKEFIKNMMTGSSQAQTAILIISAKEGVQEQTKRHAYILKMLGIKNLILAVNKMDTVDFSEQKFKEVVASAHDIISFLAVQPAHIVPISAQKGENTAKKSKHMPWFKGKCLLDVLDNVEVPQRLLQISFRFPIQDIYMFDGKKILLGTVVSGQACQGDDVIAFPQNKRKNLKTLEIFNKQLKSVNAGQSIGVTVDDVTDLKRGHVLCGIDKAPLVCDRIKANIFWLSPQPFSLHDSLSIKCGTFEEKCRVKEIYERIDSSTLAVIDTHSSAIEETQVANAVIVIEQSMVAEDFNTIEELGRFVLLREGEVCAGGIVTAQ